MRQKNITTIKLEKETKSRLDKLKEHEKESYNDLIKKTLYLLNIFRKNSTLGNKMLSNIDRTIKRRKMIENYENVNRFGKPSNLQQNL